MGRIPLGRPYRAAACSHPYAWCHDWTHRFPSIAAAAGEIGGNAILDREAVVLDEVRRSDFRALQQALGGRGGKRSSGEAIFYAFDLLYFDGHDLRQMELSERR